MHLNDALLVAWLDGELESHAVVDLQDHLSECSRCRERLAYLRDQDAHLLLGLEALDMPAPAVAAESLMRIRVGRGSFRARRVAAGLVALLAVGAAASASPAVRSFVMDLFDSRSPADVPTSEAQVSSSRGVGILPAADFDVVFVGGAVGGDVMLRWVDGPELRLEATGADIRFSIRETGLTVEGGTQDGRYVLRAPRSIVNLTVRIEDRVLFEKRGARMTGGEPVQDGLRIRLLPEAPVDVP